MKNIWNYKEYKQEFTSENTSINSNQLPRTISFIKTKIKDNSLWLDIGGGRYDNCKNFFSKNNAKLLILDPYNRTEKENNETIKIINKYKCDGVMINNVLNVIQEKEIRENIIRQAFETIKFGKFVYISIYEGNKTGISSLKTNHEKSFQMNQPTKFYLEEIKNIFQNCNIEIKKNIIIVQKNFNFTKEFKQLGIPTRNKIFGVGKHIGNSIYIHKQYIFDIMSKQNFIKYEKILLNKYKNFSYDIIKYNYKTESISFIESKDFNTSDEPTINNIININKNGDVKFIKEKKNQQIYHHKWTFVKDDYEDFDVLKSIQRSLAWKRIIKNDKEISSKIGTKDFWINLLSQFQEKTEYRKKLNF